MPPGQPIPPWTLTKEAKREWDRLCATLAPAGVLATSDADALATWAEAIALYLKAKAQRMGHDIPAGLWALAAAGGVGSAGLS